MVECEVVRVKVVGQAGKAGHEPEEPAVGLADVLLDEDYSADVKAGQA